MNGPKYIKKFPKYKGCLTVEYIPFVFKDAAICFVVFLPDVPIGTKAIVSMRINSPKYDIVNPKINKSFEVSFVKGVINE